MTNQNTSRQNGKRRKRKAIQKTDSREEKPYVVWVKYLDGLWWPAKASTRWSFTTIINQLLWWLEYSNETLDEVERIGNVKPK